MLTIVLLVVGALAVVIFLISRNAQRSNSSPHGNRSHAADALPFIIMANAADTTKHDCDGSGSTQIDGGDAGASAGSSASDCGGGSDGGGGGSD